jgi:hypothetical protein
MTVVPTVEESLAELPVLLTVEEAAGVLRISRTLAYDMVGRYEASGGHCGVSRSGASAMNNSLVEPISVPSAEAPLSPMM